METGCPTAQEHRPVEACPESKALLVQAKVTKSRLDVQQEKKGGSYPYDRLAGINKDIMLSCPQQTARQLMPGQAGFMDKGTSSHLKCIAMHTKCIKNESEGLIK